MSEDLTVKTNLGFGENLRESHRKIHEIDIREKDGTAIRPTALNERRLMFD
jgi:hypothetical protein